jgi:hypothetical protein
VGHRATGVDSGNFTGVFKKYSGATNAAPLALITCPNLVDTDNRRWRDSMRAGLES